MDIQTEVLKIFEDTGAVIRNTHVVGTSGRHMSIYVNKDNLLPHTKETYRITQLLAEACKDLDVEVVAAPATAGIVLGHLVAYHLSKIQNKEILSIYADKTESGPMIFKRGYENVIKGRKVLLVDDTVATGSSVRKMLDAVRNFGGKPIAMGVFANRVPKEINTETLGVRFFWLSEIPAETFDEKDCPLCRDNVPINIKVGHGREFLKSKGK